MGFSTFFRYAFPLVACVRNNSMHYHAERGNESKKAKKLMQQWSYFRFHYQPFVLLMQVGCYFVSLKQTIQTISLFFSRKMGPAHHLYFVDSPSYPHDGRGPSYVFFDRIFKQSKLKPNWIEFHQKKLSLVLKTLQSNSISYVVATQQGYVNNKLRKRKVSQIYISNNLNLKEAT